MCAGFSSGSIIYGLDKADCGGQIRSKDDWRGRKVDRSNTWWHLCTGINHQARTFDKLRRYLHLTSRFNFGPKDVHFGKTHFRDLRIDARIFWTNYKYLSKLACKQAYGRHMLQSPQTASRPILKLLWWNHTHLSIIYRYQA